MPLDTETLDQLRQTVRRFVDERLIPLEQQVAESDQMPPEVIQEMRELGLFGLTIPEQYGGLGLNTFEECQVVMELGRAAPAFRSIIGTNNGIGSQGIVMDGTDAQKNALPATVSQRRIHRLVCADRARCRLRCGRRLKPKPYETGDDFVITGTKRYITNAPSAQVFTVFARTDPDLPGSRGVFGVHCRCKHCRHFPRSCQQKDGPAGRPCV